MKNDTPSPRPESHKRPDKSISDRSLNKAYVILKGARHVANVHVKFPKDGAGRLELEIWSNSDKDPRFQRNTAGGYGYDKEAAALSGLQIDGHLMSDHCGKQKKPPASGVWPYEAKAPRGWSFSNYRPAEDGRPEGYTSCYREQGFNYLRAVGYTVIQAI